jgi:secondary thiamine-phosphate synthase enzyme
VTVRTKRIWVDLHADGDMADISAEAQAFVSSSGLSDGILTVFSVGSTSAVSTIEYEPGLKEDMLHAFERIAPSNVDYEHHGKWHDDNGRGHVRSTFVGTSLVVPFTEKKLATGTWQQIVVMNLDTSPRKREVVLQVLGE